MCQFWLCVCVCVCLVGGSGITDLFFVGAETGGRKLAAKNSAHLQAFSMEPGPAGQDRITETEASAAACVWPNICGKVWASRTYVLCFLAESAVLPVTARQKREGSSKMAHSLEDDRFDHEKPTLWPIRVSVQSIWTPLPQRLEQTQSPELRSLISHEMDNVITCKLRVYKLCTECYYMTKIGTWRSNSEVS